MEGFSRTAGVEVLCFRPWERIPGLCQGVTVRPARSEPELTYRHLSAGMREEGFAVIRRLNQLHGARVVKACRGAGKSSAGGGDGLVSFEAGVLGLVTTADCVPVFVLDPVSACWGLLHAGWRGVAAGVITEGLRVMQESLGVSARKLELYLGPSICASCYEVGPEVVRVLAKVRQSGVEKRSGGRFYVNLRQLLSVQAASCGVRPENIFASKYCTRCHNDLFYSFRAEGRSALRRMWAFMGRM